MTITLNHTVVFAKDNDKAAHEFAENMGLKLEGYEGIDNKFATVRINAELSVFFMTIESDTPQQHLAFSVDEHTFDQILDRLRERNVTFGNSPHEPNNQRTDHPFAPRGLFWANLDGCLVEVMTDES
ncbi:VOC family protein [Oceanobacillus sojae]|uniref:VOC family protein n=1 Tax=Oceanobacillus sojae TaxID=582851 RepID=UPI00098879FF|nr:VOC family protein [Oceanobacillus sojae]